MGEMAAKLPERLARLLDRINCVGREASESSSTSTAAAGYNGAVVGNGESAVATEGSTTTMTVTTDKQQLSYTNSGTKNSFVKMASVTNNPYLIKNWQKDKKACPPCPEFLEIDSRISIKNADP